MIHCLKRCAQGGDDRDRALSPGPPPFGGIANLPPPPPVSWGNMLSMLESNDQNVRRPCICFSISDRKLIASTGHRTATKQQRSSRRQTIGIGLTFFVRANRLVSHISYCFATVESLQPSGMPPPMPTLRGGSIAGWFRFCQFHVRMKRREN
jgi:hypothetical protein